MIRTNSDAHAVILGPTLALSPLSGDDGAIPAGEIAVNRRLPTSRAKPVGDHRRLVGAISSTTAPPGATHSSAPSRIVCRSSSPTGPARSASEGSHRPRRREAPHRRRYTADWRRVHRSHHARSSVRHRTTSLREDSPGRRPAKSGEVGPSHGECIERPVGGEHGAAAHSVAMAAERTDPVPRSATTTSVRRRFERRPLRSQARRRLGLRPRDQHPPVDHEIEVTESPPADDVLEGFAAFTTGDQSVEQRRRGRWQQC